MQGLGHSGIMEGLGQSEVMKGLGQLGDWEIEEVRGGLRQLEVMRDWDTRR